MGAQQEEAGWQMGRPVGHWFNNGDWDDGWLNKNIARGDWEKTHIHRYLEHSSIAK